MDKSLSQKAGEAYDTIKELLNRIETLEEALEGAHNKLDMQNDELEDARSEVGELKRKLSAAHWLIESINKQLQEK